MNVDMSDKDYLSANKQLCWYSYMVDAISNVTQPDVNWSSIGSLYWNKVVNIFNHTIFFIHFFHPKLLDKDE